jgi:hypothetical protein
MTDPGGSGVAHVGTAVAIKPTATAKAVANLESKRFT